MTIPTVKNLLPQTYGGNVTTTELTVANRGFTARTFTPATEGVSTTSESTLISGFTPVANASTQGITFASLAVNANSGTKFKFAIRPNNATSVTTSRNSLYRERLSTSTALESLDYNAVNSTGIDRSQFLFSGTQLGVENLRLGGTVNASQAGAYSVIGASGGTPNTYATKNGLTGSGVLNGPLLGTESYGSWVVNVNIQALLTNYELFTLESGSPVMDDYTLENLDGTPVKFSHMDNISDVDGNFIEDFNVDPSKYQIVKQFVSTKIKFYAGSFIPEGTLINFAPYVAGTYDLTVSGNYMEYAYGVYPVYNFYLSQGSSIDIAVDIAEGFVVPSGQKIPLGSNFTDVDGEIIIDSLTLDNLKAKRGFELPSDVVLTGVILMDSDFHIRKGQSSSYFQPVVTGMNTDEPLSLEGVQFPNGASLESSITIDEDFIVLESITLGKNSTLKKGTMIPKGSQTLEGALINSTITIAGGASVTSRVDIESQFIIDASTSGSNPIMEGAILHGPFIFPVGTQLTNGNVLPAALKILMTMGVSLSAGMEIAAGSIFGSTAMLFGDIGFSKNGMIPSLSTLFGTFTFPFNTRFSAGFNSNFSIPVPDRTVLIAGSTIHNGTSFKEGSQFPEIADLSSQAGAAYSGSGSVGPLTKFTDSSSGLYLVFKAGTVFLPGFLFPVGTIMSANATPGHTGYLGTGVYGASTTTSPYTETYELSPGSYSLDESVHAPAQDTFTFTPGVATTELVVMLTDTSLPTDVVIPISGIDPSSGQYISMNEVFTLLTDIVLIDNYTVHGNNNVIWPSNIPIPNEFVLTSAFTFTTPTSGSQISKSIHFNFLTNCKYINNIVSSTSSIKLPPAGFILDEPIKLAVNQPVSNSGTNAFKSTVTLAQGTKLKLVGSYVQLIIPMHVETDFTVNAELLTFPQITLKNGITLLCGQITPGNIVVGINSPLPKNLTLDQDIVLSTDLVVKESNYSLNQNTLLISGSILGRETNFPSGADFSAVTLAPILSLSTANIFFLLEDVELTSRIAIPYLYNSSTGMISSMSFNSGNLIKKIEEIISALEANNIAIASLQGNISNYNPQVIRSKFNPTTHTFIN